jgi:hypothetical protein
MMEPLILLKKLSNHEFVEHHPKKTHKITSFFFQRSPSHKIVSDFGNKMHNILKLSVGRKYFLFFLAGSRGRYPNSDAASGWAGWMGFSTPGIWEFS